MCVGTSFFASLLRPDTLIFMIPIVAILSGSFVAALKVLRGPQGVHRENSEEDARLIQDIHNGLLRMEQRVEALETIMLDREHSRRPEE